MRSIANKKRSAVVLRFFWTFNRTTGVYTVWDEWTNRPIGRCVTQEGADILANSMNAA